MVRKYGKRIWTTNYALQDRSSSLVKARSSRFRLCMSPCNRLLLIRETWNRLQELSLQIHAINCSQALLFQTLHCCEAVREIHKAVEHPIQRIKDFIVGLPVPCAKCTVRGSINHVRHAWHYRSRRGKR